MRPMGESDWSLWVRLPVVVVCHAYVREMFPIRKQYNAVNLFFSRLTV